MSGERTERREVVVGRIGKVHGLRGEVSVEPRTDEPDRRFADGAVLRTQTPRGTAPHGADRPTSLTVRTVRWHQSRLLVTFDEVADRTAAEALRGLTLVVDVDIAEEPDDPEEFYDHQLVGLAVSTTGTSAETNGTSTSRSSGVRTASRSWPAPWTTWVSSPTVAPSVVTTLSPTSWWS